MKIASKILTLMVALFMCATLVSAQQKPAKTWWEQIKENTRAIAEQETPAAAPAEVAPKVEAVVETPVKAEVAPVAVPVEAEVAAVAVPEEATVATVASASAQDTLSIALMLPFNAKGTPDNASFSIYSGALMAAQEFGLGGYPLKLNVFDCKDPRSGITPLTFFNNDILIGPISRSDIEMTISSVPKGKFLVSPLEPGVAALTDSLNIIQAPTAWNRQISRLTSWACEDLGAQDSLVILRDKSATEEAYTQVRGCIEEIGVPCVIISCETVEDVLEIVTPFVSKTGTTRFIVASEKEAFVRRILDVIATFSKNGLQVASYCTSKVRSFYSIAPETLSEASVRAVAAYFYDEKSVDSQRFSIKYKELFGVKPSQFAIQGYDLVKYFVSIYREYGESWADHLDSYKMQGIHANFDFVRGGNGFVNQGVRQIIY